jgi:sugar (pentulose or hexulose) kinase
MVYILGVDIGTTAIKAAVFNYDGEECGSATEEYQLITPENNIVELDAQTYVDKFVQAVQNAIKKAKINKNDIASIGFSSQGETFVCLDDKNQPIRNAIVWMDNRAVEEAKYIENYFGKDIIHKITGQVGMDAIWPASKMMWLLKNEPENYKKTAKFILIKEYIIYLLTGKFVCEDSILCSTMWWDINTRLYWKEMLELLEIDENQLPKIVQQGEVVGSVTADASKKYGLPQNLNVSVGALDQSCGALGVGNISPGIFSESTGSALTSVTILDDIILDPNKEMPCFASAVPGKYMLHAFSTGGMVNRWFRDTFCSGEKYVESVCGINAYSMIDEEVKQVPEGSKGLIFLPHLQGSGPPDSNNNAKGVFFGITLAHDKKYFSRSIMEGVTMVLRRMIEATESLDIGISEIISLGGGSKSDIWCQIKANATGKPVHIMKDTEGAASFGSAILAGVGVGLWSSYEDITQKAIKIEKIYYPEPKSKAVYDKTYNNYKRLQTCMNGLFEEFK